MDAGTSASEDSSKTLTWKTELEAACQNLNVDVFRKLLKENEDVDVNTKFVEDADRYSRRERVPLQLVLSQLKDVESNVEIVLQITAVDGDVVCRMIDGTDICSFLQTDLATPITIGVLDRKIKELHPAVKEDCVFFADGQPLTDTDEIEDLNLITAQVTIEADERTKRGKATAILDMTRTLLEARADPNIQSGSFRKVSLLGMCKNIYSEDVARLLLEANINLGESLRPSKLHRQETHSNPLCDFVGGAPPEVLDTILPLIEDYQPLRRDLLHWAMHLGSEYAGSKLDEICPMLGRNGSDSRRQTLQDRSAEMGTDGNADERIPMIVFQLPQPSEGALRDIELPEIVLVGGDVKNWPCDALLLDATNAVQGTSGASEENLSNVTKTLLEDVPELMETLQAERPHSSDVSKCVAQGKLPAVYVLWTSLQERRTSYGKKQCISGPGSLHGESGVESLLLKTFLNTLSFARQSDCQYLAIHGLGEAQGACLSPTEVASVLLNALILQKTADKRARFNDRRPVLKEVAVITTTAEQYASYRATFSALNATQQWQSFFRKTDPENIVAACPQPVRQPTVCRQMKDVLLDASCRGICQRTRELKTQSQVRGFLAHDLLSRQECADIINAAEAVGFEGVDWEYAPEYRDCRRVVFHDVAVALGLWERLLPLLNLKDIYDVRPIGWGAEGVWAPCGINECLRVSRYDVGGHFAMHRDGPFVVNDDLRSIFTVLVYLNTDFGDGSTVFEHSDGSDVVAPHVGAAVVFAHEARHEGTPVTSGKKYVLRTDIMFRRVDRLSLQKHGKRYQEDPKWQHCEKLYHESIEMQNLGDVKGSTTKYLEALDMQADVACKRQKIEKMNGLLPDAAWDAILRYFSNDKVVAMASLSRRARNLALGGGVWQERYARRWLATSLESNPFAAWYTLYKYRCAAEECWRVACFEIGLQTSRYLMLGSGPQAVQKARMLPSVFWDDDYYYSAPLRNASENKDENTPLMIGSMPSLVRRCRGHYWGASSGYKQYCVGWDAATEAWGAGDVRWAYAEGEDRQNPDDEVIMEIIRYSFAFGFEHACWPSEHPLLIVIPPHLSTEGRALLTKRFADKICNMNILPNTPISYGNTPEVLLSVPYLLFENHCDLALLAAGCTSGISIHLAEISSVTIVLPRPSKYSSEAKTSDPIVSVIEMPKGLGFHSTPPKKVSRTTSAERNEAEESEQEPRQKAKMAQLMSEISQALDRMLAQPDVRAHLGVDIIAVITADGDSAMEPSKRRVVIEEVTTRLHARTDIKVVKVHAEKAVMQGAAAMAATLEGRSRFRSAEGAPPPVAVPGLRRIMSKTSPVEDAEVKRSDSEDSLYK